MRSAWQGKGGEEEVVEKEDEDEVNEEVEE